MSQRTSRRVFVEMLREEWRLHSRLFSGRRFAAFPVFIALLVAGATELLVFTGRDLGLVYAGMHALAFFFGLNTGSIGFVGRDAIRNLLGDLTLLVFSARTLPLSQRRLFGVFLVKDVVYYALLFLLPMAVGVAPVLVYEGLASAGATAETVTLLWLTMVGTFVLGIGATVAGLGLARRRIAGPLSLLALVAVGGYAVLQDVPVLDFTPYGIFRTPGAESIVGSLLLLVGVFAVGALTFDLSDRKRVRAVDPAFRAWDRRIGDPLATKTLLDVHRSSGGFGKVVFSGAILLAVTWALVDLAGQITGVEPSVAISFGAILGLTGFTTYNWLTQFDDVAGYRHQPLDVTEVFAAKFRAFLVLGPVVGLAFYAVGVVWQGSPVGSGIVGAVLLVGVATYIFGVTVALTGLSPNEFLFDTVLFAVFGAAVMVPLVPILIVGFALAPVGPVLLAGLGASGIGLGALGVWLYRRSLPRWVRYHRS